MAGRYSTTNSSTSCTACSAGTFSTIIGANSSSTCIGCPNGTFSITSGGNALSTCIECPVGTYSTSVGSNSSSVCVNCPPGTYNSNTGVGLLAGCLPCPDGTYSSTIGANTSTHCLPCSAGTYTTSAGGNSINACIPCRAGTYSLTVMAGSNATCLQCAAGKYSGVLGATSDSSCIDCPPGSFSLAGASTCTLCPANSYSSVFGATSNSSCQPCLNGMVSDAGASSCVCPPGFQASETACNACPAGTYKSRIGNFTCTPCGPNLFSAAIGAINDSVCSNCAENMSFIIGSSGCACQAGYEPDDFNCNKCQPGTYKTATGNFSCTLCPSNTYSVIGGINSSVCLACETNLGSLPGSSICSCAAGFEPIGNLCSPCSPGSFKSASGNFSCTPCAANTYSTSVGATSSNVCIACSGSMKSVIGSSACSCDAGLQPNGSSCVPCPIGHYKATFGNWTCTPCDSDTFSTAVGANSSIVCTPCEVGFKSPPGSSVCSCRPGFTPGGNGLSCVECPSGTYKSATGNWSCTPCSSNTYSTSVGATSENFCLPCGTNLGSSAGSSLCACNAGYEPNGMLCIPCVAGSYKSGSGNWSCTLCSSDTYLATTGATSINSCLACPGHLGSPIGSTFCSCRPGFEPDDSSCVPCSAGSFKTSFSNGRCRLCPANTYSIVTGANTSDVCLPCGPNSISSPGSSFCVCNAGFEPTSSGCVACPIGKFKSQAGNSSCASCNTNQNSLLGAAECYTCTATASPPSSPVSPYNCPPGQEPNGAFCIPCVAGRYKSSTSNTTCVNCDASLYSLPGATVCSSCGSNSIATTGSTTCSCRAGYYPSNGACIACPVNTYKSNIGNDICANCGANTTSNGTACFCLITHFGNPESGCLPCSNNKTRSQTTSSYTSDADCTVDTTATDSPTIPTPPNNSANANPLASMMGVSNEIFLAIVGSVGGIIVIALIATTVVIRKRFQKQKEQLLQATRRGVVSAGGQQNPEAGILAPLMGNAIMPYSTNNRTSNMMSMQRQGSIYPTNGMSTTYTGVTNGTTARSFGGATLATTGPNWRQ